MQSFTYSQFYEWCHSGAMTSACNPLPNPSSNDAHGLWDQCTKPRCPFEQPWKTLLYDIGILSWLIILGILEMDYYNPPCTRNNRGFGHPSFLLDTSNSYHQTISRMVGNRRNDDTESTPWLGEVQCPSRHTTRCLESNATRVRIYNIYPPWN